MPDRPDLRLRKIVFAPVLSASDGEAFKQASDAKIREAIEKKPAQGA
jgi:hypothetical protein